MEYIKKLYGKEFYQDKDWNTKDRLNFLFGSFTDEAYIINLINETIALNHILEYYDIFARSDYLKVAYSHLSMILQQQAVLLGRINRVRISWDDSLENQFQKLVNDKEKEKIFEEYESLINRYENFEKAEEEKIKKNHSVAKDIFTMYFNLFTLENFPDKTLVKLYHISKSTLNIMTELIGQIDKFSYYEIQ